MPRQPFPSSLQDRALDLLAQGWAVKDVAAELHLSRSTVYRWRQARSLTTTHQLLTRQSELNAAQARIAELENELLAHRRLTRRLSDAVPPTGRFEAIRVMASEGHQVRTAAALLRVSESGYYAWCRRAPSGRMLRHAWLTELILSIYRSSKAMYGSRRIHHGRTRWAAAQTLDSRTSERLWAVDVRAQHTPTGTLYCAVVLDTNQRRLMGWSVNGAVTHELVHTALDMALTRDAGPFPHTAYAFTERTRILALAPATARVPDQYAQASVDHFWRRVGRDLLPKKQWNTTESLQIQLEKIFEKFSSPAPMSISMR
jgi:transposase